MLPHMPDDKPSFVLRRIIWSDGQPSHEPEDYSVRENDRAVGCIYHTTGGARGSGYAWFIYGSSTSGFAPTREAAAAEWKVAYRRFLEG